MPGHLKKFSAGEVFLTQSDAWSVLHFIFGDTRLAHYQLTWNDCAFAQALLLEAIDASAKIGAVEAIFRHVLKPNPNVKEVIKKLVRYAVKSWWRHARGDDLKRPKIYRMVQQTLNRNFKSIWGSRIATGDLDY